MSLVKMAGDLIRRHTLRCKLAGKRHQMATRILLVVPDPLHRD